MRRQFKANAKKLDQCRTVTGNGCRIDTGTKNKETKTDPSKEETQYTIDDGIEPD